MSAASAAAAQAVRGDVTRPYSELLRLALPAVLNQSARPLAALVTVGLVGHSSCGGTAALPPTSELGAGDDYDNDADVRAMCTSLQMLAAFSAVTATVAFVQGVFNFLVTVTWAQLGKLAIGEQRWEEVGGRVRQAACVALLAGCGCAAVLWAMRGPILASMALEPRVEALAYPFFGWKLLTVPPIFLHQTAMGVLGGYQRLYCLSALNVLLAATDTAVAWAALYPLTAGLSGLGFASLVISVCSMLLSWSLVAALPPAGAAGRIQLLPVLPCGVDRRRRRRPATWRQIDGGQDEDGDDGGGGTADIVGATCAIGEEQQLAGSAAQQPPPPPPPQQRDGQASHKCAKCPRCEYLRSACDQMIRSTVLSASIWLMTLCAARMSSEALAAHQVSVMVAAFAHRQNVSHALHVDVQNAS
jgi:Na+-driven multidrug efflux pump